MKKYKILISVLAYDNGKSGIADYINNVIGYLSQTNQLDILIYEKDRYIFPHKNENINFLPVSNRYSKALVSMVYHLFVLPHTLPLDEYDFVFLPAGNRRLFSVYPKKTIVTFHDLSQFHIEKKYDVFRMYYIKKVVPYFLKKAQIVMAISESTKKDLIKYYNLPEKNIDVNYNGFDTNKLNISCSEEELRNKYNIEGRYILYIARIEHPGKNHINLIKAYEMLPETIKQEYQLVFAGSEWNRAEEVLAYARLSVDRKRILFLGFVPEKDLGSLYNYASLYAFPSFYEGFGIPLLEAMFCETPVVCSNVSSLPEVGGHAVITFDPESPTNMSEVIKYTLENEKVQQQMIELGKEQTKKFSWEKHCQKIIDLVESFED